MTHHDEGAEDPRLLELEKGISIDELEDDEEDELEHDEHEKRDD